MMKLSSLAKFSAFGIGTILFRRKKPILGTIIITQKCNLTCKHCAVYDTDAPMYPYAQIQVEMRRLYEMGVRILFFSGGETFMWRDAGKTPRDLVVEARQMGFLIVNVVTNGTYPIDLPEADLILLSLDGGRENHNLIRGDTYDTILHNIRNATAGNICFYMALNKLNKSDIAHVCELARAEPNVRAASFNFHVPYPGTEDLSLTLADKEECCASITEMMRRGHPVFNLRSALPHIVRNTFKTPCHQCVVVEKGKYSVCGRCIDLPGMCEKCGYFFAAEYSLVFGGNLRVIIEMLRTYPKYI